MPSYIPANHDPRQGLIKPYQTWVYVPDPIDPNEPESTGLNAIFWILTFLWIIVLPVGLITIPLGGAGLFILIGYYGIWDEMKPPSCEHLFKTRFSSSS